MTAAPRFPLVESGYDPAAVDAFVMKLVERARREIEGIRTELDASRAETATVKQIAVELEAALCAVAEADWDPIEEAASATAPEETSWMMQQSTIPDYPAEEAESSTEDEAPVPVEIDVDEPAAPGSVDVEPTWLAPAVDFVPDVVEDGAAETDVDAAESAEDDAEEQVEPLDRREQMARLAESRIRRRRGTAAGSD